MTKLSRAALLVVIALLAQGCTDPQLRQYNDALRALNRGDLATAAKTINSLAQNGHARSQFRLGVMFLHGTGLPQDAKRAAYWFEKAAGQNHPAGRYSLARLYLAGVGVEKSPALARRQLLPLAEQGFVPAQLQLGLLLDAGIGGERDVGEARRWVQAAAESHHPQALEAMAQAYEKGLLGLEPDPQQARAWRERAKPKYF